MYIADTMKNTSFNASIASSERDFQQDLLFKSKSQTST